MTTVSADEWSRLPVDDVVDILSCDELNVPDERCVLDAALKWLNHQDDDARRFHAARVLAAVKLPLLPPQVVVCHLTTRKRVAQTTAMFNSCLLTKQATLGPRAEYLPEKKTLVHMYRDLFELREVLKSWQFQAATKGLVTCDGDPRNQSLSPLYQLIWSPNN